MKKFCLKPSSVLNRCLFSVVCILFSTSLCAQEPEYGESTGYIDAKYGIKEFQIPYTYTYNDVLHSGTSPSFYAIDSSGKPATLLWSNFAGNSSNNGYKYRVLYGTTRIAKGAFIRLNVFCTIYIPSTLRYIPEDLFKSNINLIIDDSETRITSVNDVKEDNPQAVKEVARYNIQGIKTNKQEKGPKIIQYNNGSAKKVITQR